MSAIVELDLEKLALDAAEYVAGAGVAEQVDVESSVDWWYRPTYVFTYLINLDRTQMNSGLLLIRLLEKLHEDLIEKGDEHRPSVHLLDKADWAKFRHAKSV
jgi:hypothetical protein